jgi:hypothetical protein
MFIGYGLLVIERLMFIGYGLLVIERLMFIGYGLLVIESSKFKVDSLKFRVVECLELKVDSKICGFCDFCESFPKLQLAFSFFSFLSMFYN